MQRTRSRNLGTSEPNLVKKSLEHFSNTPYLTKVGNLYFIL